MSAFESFLRIVGLLVGICAGLVPIFGRERLIKFIRTAVAGRRARDIWVMIAAALNTWLLAICLYVIAHWLYNDIADPFLRMWLVGLCAGLAGSFGLLICFSFYWANRSIDGGTL